MAGSWARHLGGDVRLEMATRRAWEMATRRTWEMAWRCSCARKKPRRGRSPRDTGDPSGLTTITSVVNSGEQDRLPKTSTLAPAAVLTTSGDRCSPAGVRRSLGRPSFRLSLDEAAPSPSCSTRRPTATSPTLRRPAKDVTITPPAGRIHGLVKPGNVESKRKS